MGEVMRPIRKKPGERVIHEVEQGSNLDLILRGHIGAINKLASAIAPPGKSLAEALERSGGGANEEVLAKLNRIIELLEADPTAIVEKLSATKEKLQGALDRNKPKGE